MGLTIHYSLTTPLTEATEIRDLVESLRQFASDLQFKEVGELLEFQGREADYEQTDRDEPTRWFKIQAGAHVIEEPSGYAVKPQHVIGFSAWPGEGCEQANLGFGQYPQTITVPTDSGRRRRLATKLDGWRWHSFCKTQYASDPSYGGVGNFLRCHLCVVKLLDFAQKTGLIHVEVHDEGGYWEQRNVEALAREVGQWNELVAAMAGLLKDATRNAGGDIEAAIAGFPNFEHLEARGLERLRRLQADRERSKD